ncbi:MAG: hypothetical protein R3F17_10360 [Planctomycetota bacterium]
MTCSQLAFVLDHQGSHKEALEICERLQRVDAEGDANLTQYQRNARRLAMQLYQRGLPESVRNLERSRELGEIQVQAQPDDWEAWSILGDAYLLLGRYPDGLQALERCIACIPQDEPNRAKMEQYYAAMHTRFSGR